MCSLLKKKKKKNSQLQLLYLDSLVGGKDSIE